MVAALVSLGLRLKRGVRCGGGSLDRTVWLGRLLSLGWRKGRAVCTAQCPEPGPTNQEDRWRVKEKKQGAPQGSRTPLTVGLLGQPAPECCLSAHFTGEINSREAGLLDDGRELGPKPTSLSILPWGPSPQGHLWTKQGWGVKPRQRIRRHGVGRGGKEGVGTGA